MMKLDRVRIMPIMIYLAICLLVLTSFGSDFSVDFLAPFSIISIITWMMERGIMK